MDASCTAMGKVIQVTDNIVDYASYIVSQEVEQPLYECEVKVRGWRVQFDYRAKVLNIYRSH